MSIIYKIIKMIRDEIILRNKLFSEEMKRKESKCLNRGEVK